MTSAYSVLKRFLLEAQKYFIARNSRILFELFTNGHVDNVVSTMSNVLKLEVENDVFSTLTNVVNINVEIDNADLIL